MGNFCDVMPGILIDKAVKVMCETSPGFSSLLRCSHSAVKKLSAARFPAFSRSGSVARTN